MIPLDKTQNCKYFRLRPVTHVIFDLDGTLVDSEGISHNLWKKLVESHDKVLPADFKYRYRGSPAVYTLKGLIEELNIESTVAELQKEMRKLEDEIYATQSVDLIKGVEKLIKHFHKHNIPMAIATSSSKRQAELKMRNHMNIFQFINHVVTSDDVLIGKPNPKVYHLAAQKFPARPKPSSCLVFEDTPNGLKAADAAKMQCVFIPQMKVDDENLKEMATIILKSIEDFEPEIFALPSMRKTAKIHLKNK